MKASAHNKNIREPAVAGQFYSADAKELQDEVDAYINNAKIPELSGQLIALVSPHAGYVYSGHVAGYAYKTLIGKKFDTAILVGLSHRYPISGAVVCDTGVFMTPLGNAEVDSELAESILKNNGIISVNSAAHKSEHSLEVQLPFLQRVAKEAKIVPILLNNSDTETCDQVAEAIATAIRKIKKSVILIASTDLTHYPAYRYAVEVDKEAIAAMLALDVDKLDTVTDKWMNKGIPNLHCVVCSEAAVKVVIQTSKKLGANQAKLLKYANSGEVSVGDKSQVVGYAAIAITKI
jgi:hypothetical protein